MSLHFTAPRDLTNGLTRMKWVQMRFPWEFQETLKQYGQLPINSVEKALKMQNELYQLKKYLSRSKQGTFFLDRFEDMKASQTLKDEIESRNSSCRRRTR